MHKYMHGGDLSQVKRISVQFLVRMVLFNNPVTYQQLGVGNMIIIMIY